MKRLIVWASMAAGAYAAYLMYKRGVPLGTIARKTIVNPVGTLVNEIKEGA